MEIKHVEEYEKPEYNTFQLKTGKMLTAGIACMAILGLSGTLAGCIERTLGTPPVSITEPVAAQQSSTTPQPCVTTSATLPGSTPTLVFTVPGTPVPPIYTLFVGIPPVHIP